MPGEDGEALKSRELTLALLSWSSGSVFPDDVYARSRHLHRCGPRTGARIACYSVHHRRLNAGFSRAAIVKRET